jgi:hypothetical protein
VANVASISEVRAAVMVVLLMVGNYKKLGSSQWHDVHTKFNKISIS